MAKRKTTTVAEASPKAERKRTFVETSVTFEVWGENKSTGETEKLAEAKSAPAALATLQLAESMGVKTHSGFYVRKTAMLVLNNGELTSE